MHVDPCEPPSGLVAEERQGGAARHVEPTPAVECAEDDFPSASTTELPNKRQRVAYSAAPKGADQLIEIVPHETDY